MKLLLVNIRELCGVSDWVNKPLRGGELSVLKKIENAWIYIEDGIIHSYGTMASLSSDFPSFYESDIIDVKGRIVLPAWCDSHSHIVFAHWREHEFVDKIKGLTYEEIAKRGGGILNTVRSVRQADEEFLYETAMQRVEEVISYGTGALEIKSGYGLSMDDEIKMLRVIKRIKKKSPLVIKSTFLGAHSIPPEYQGRADDYVTYLIQYMIPRVVDEELADYIDVFCDKGFFTIEQTERILEAAAKYGLRAKLHANELDYSGGVQVGVKYGAVSVDHLEHTGDDEIQALQKSETIATILPNVSFYLNIPYAPVRKMIDSGLPVALASDYNPGSSPSGNMQFVISLACIKCKMLPEEAINASTINGAFAMQVQNLVGSITVGKKANIIILKDIPSLAYIPYAFGQNKVDKVILNGVMM